MIELYLMAVGRGRFFLGGGGGGVKTIFIYQIRKWSAMNVSPAYGHVPANFHLAKLQCIKTSSRGSFLEQHSKGCRPRLTQSESIEHQRREDVWH